MTTPPIQLMLALLLSLAAPTAIAQSTTTEGSAKSAAKTEPLLPVLRNTCIVTKDVPRLVDFYTRVLRIPAKTTDSDYAEFRTPAAALAIFSAAAQEKYIPGSAGDAGNKSLILEFEVSDVDLEYARLQKLVKDWVRPPTTQPWGTRSFYFRDPDGNLIDFYKWIKAQ